MLMTRNEKMALGGLALGGAGLIVGTLTGLLGSGETWERVPTDRAFSVRPGRQGGIVLAYSIRR
jgi:hypothetical protein